jgi:hypothetical protein
MDIAIQTTNSKTKSKKLIEKQKDIVNYLDSDLNRDDICYIIILLFGYNF